MCTSEREREKNNDEEKKYSVRFNNEAFNICLVKEEAQKNWNALRYLAANFSLVAKKYWTAGYHRGNKEHLCILIYCVCYSMRASPAHALNRMLIGQFQYSFISAWLKFYTRVKFVSLWLAFWETLNMQSWNSALTLKVLSEYLITKIIFGKWDLVWMALIVRVELKNHYREAFWTLKLLSWLY